MGKSKKVAVPTVELEKANATIDAVCSRRLDSNLSESQVAVINCVRNAMKEKIEKIVAADSNLDKQLAKETEIERKLKRARSEIAETSARISELRESVPQLANGIVEDENKVKVTDISIEAKNQSEGMSEEAKAQAFAGMKETMKKLEQNLEDVGREMPEKLESLQTTIESVTTVLENKGKSTIEDEITARENEDPQTKKRRRSGGGIGTTAEKVFDKFVSHVGR